MNMRSTTFLLAAVLASFPPALLISACAESRCYDDADCSENQTCDTTNGQCRYECEADADCSPGFRCEDHHCRVVPIDGDSEQPLVCPGEMVKIAETFCIDRYEASRPDATAASIGSDESRALSVEGVLPWQVADNAAAQAACEANGKRLCHPDEWRLACRGADDNDYTYGDAYKPAACNGIEALGGGDFRLMPTGSFSDCTNGWGVYDLSGNIWEHVFNGSDQTVRGGAYNCRDPLTMHRCDYIPGNWTPAALGFRCCATPESDEPDGDEEIDPQPDGDDEPEPPDGDSEEEDSGCIVTDGDEEIPDTEIDAPDMDEAEEDAGDVEGEPETEPDIDPEPEIDSGCPAEMVAIDAFCIDRYEASRADATESSPGASSTPASRPGVLPWYVSPMSAANAQTFRDACASVGKRLCGSEEWFEACNGPDDTEYVFGDIWDREPCNCVDTFCDDYCAEHGVSPCDTSQNCGYQYSCFHIEPTGRFPTCTNAYGHFDINGNVWEIVEAPSDPRGYGVRGGAFNCGTPSLRLQCGFGAGWDDLYAGFRCCKDRE
ncbi:MAG: hypothetical protein C4523_01475 [Myxococcales bacterium]|nr:MAG: hypothetical protein C4523_01475 [Myxococcales bacterium]